MTDLPAHVLRAGGLGACDPPASRDHGAIPADELQSLAERGDVVNVSPNRGPTARPARSN